MGRYIGKGDLAGLQRIFGRAEELLALHRLGDTVQHAVSPGEAGGAVAVAGKLLQAAVSGIPAIKFVHAAAVAHPFQGVFHAAQVRHLLGRCCQHAGPFALRRQAVEAEALLRNAAHVDVFSQPGLFGSLHAGGQGHAPQYLSGRGVQHHQERSSLDR